ncbi:MAG: helix-hairpin-helix domain-containing protein [Planctomycetes bacterium]|nr:helix-hairpin-helix domain-containing protein [Planctomycetota bacterium]
MFANRALGFQPAAGLIGLVVLIATFFGMRRGVWPFTTHVYDFVWWSTIVFFDGLVWWRRGRSPLAASPRRWMLLSLWSVVFWFFFELINLRLHNWYYINVAPDTFARWWGSFVAFATVLPGVLLCAELLGAGWRVGKSSPGKLPTWCLNACVGVGVVFFILPLIWPRNFYPLVWGGVFLFLDPLNYRASAFSFLGEIECRRFGAIGRILAAGLLCGLWWELWNYWARVKWIYTVPFFEDQKLFEMPILGFLGFPPFALECVALAAALERLGFIPGTAPRRSSPLSGMAAMAAALALSGIALPYMDRGTFASTYPYLEDFREIDLGVRGRLEEEGVRDGFQLLERAGRGDPALAPWRHFIELSMLEGIGPETARALKSCGIESVSVLALARDEELHSCLARQPLRHQPSRAEIRVWIRDAKKTESQAGE